MARFKEYLFSNNPVLVQTIGFCSVLAVSSSMIGAIGMALSFTFVMVLSNMAISLLRNFIPSEIRIPAYIVVIASFVTILQMVLQAYFETVFNILGIFLPLIVVNCIILGRAEAYASKHGLVDSMLDGLANGLGYSFVILVVAFIRELIGVGELFGTKIIPEEFSIPFFSRPASAFILLGIFVAVVNFLGDRKKQKSIQEQTVQEPAGTPAERMAE